MMILYALNLFRRSLITRELIAHSLRRQVTSPRPVRAVDYHSLVADKDCACSRNFVVGWEAIRSCNRHTAIVPDQFYRSTILLGGKLICDFRSWRIRSAVLCGIIIRDFRHDAYRSSKIQSPERRVDDVAEPITYRTGPEVHPAPPVPRNPERCVGLELNRSHPSFIIEFRRDIVVLRQFVQVPNLAIYLFELAASGVDGVNLTHCAGPNPLAQSANRCERMALIA